MSVMMKSGNHAEIVLAHANHESPKSAALPFLRSVD